MFIRGTVLDIGPDRVADAVADIEATVVPVLREQPGYQGTVVVKLDEGGMRVNTLWSDEAALHASEPAVTELRRQVAERAGASVVRIEVLEVFLRDPDDLPTPGTATRAAVLANDNDDVQSGVDAFTADILPQLRLQDGYRMALLAGNRAQRMAVSIAGWRDRAAREAADAALAKLRHEVVDKVGSRVVQIQTGEIIHCSRP